jgi:hypothetical protein
MEYTEILNPIIELIKPYDPIDLLAKVGALQLFPENADHILRLEALAYAVNCLKYELNKPAISRRRLDLICNKPPLGDGYIQSQEDPTPNAFTEAITFFGGSFIVFPGQVMDHTFILQNLNRAILLDDGFRAYRHFRDKVFSLNQSILTLSDCIAKRRGFTRNLPPKSNSRDIYIPQEIKEEKRSVIFSYDELEKLLGSVNQDISSLEPFIQEFGILDAGLYSMENNPLYSQPIVRINNEFIITEPLMLLASLRYQILRSAKDLGVLELLAKEYQIAVVHNVGASLDRFHYQQVGYQLPEIKTKLNLLNSIWTLDSDKILFAIVITDDLTGYIGSEVFENNPKFGEREEGKLIDEYLGLAEKQIQHDFVDLREIFFLIINGELGRESIFGLELDKISQNSTVLMLSASELEVLSFLRGHDDLILYKFAKAQDKIRDSTMVVSWDTLDEFAVYRHNEFSYYLDDGPKPSLISITPGEGRKLRVEFLQNYDRHAVPFLEYGSWIEVVNIHQVPSCPIYAPLNYRNKLISFFVELRPIPFWVISNLENINFENDGRIPNPSEFVDMIAYWIWQFGDELSKSLADIDDDSPIIFEVKIDESGKWGLSKTEYLSETDPISFSDDYGHTITVTIKPPIISLLSSPDNSGEIQFMRMLLDELSKHLDRDGWLEQSEKLRIVLPELVNKHTSNPRKKKIILLEPGQSPELLPGNLFSYRKVKEADRSILLDQTGEFLVNELKLEKGILPRERHNEILNSIVHFYFERLSSIIHNLKLDHLLEFLISLHEAVVTEKYTRQITIPTQLACYSSNQELVQQLVKHLPELDEAALSARFLIEFVVAQPPTGTIPISFALYDQMMALASEIIAKGSQSDLDRYGLYDFQLKVLDSGRLGSNLSDYSKIMNTYQGFRSKAIIYTAEKDFSEWWREKKAVDEKDMPPEVRELDQAFNAEFGIYLNDIALFISELGSISMEMPPNVHQMKEMERNKLISEMTKLLGWSNQKVTSIVEFLSLSPRKDFLRPSLPFTKADIYPWRMGRGLSYIRRPLLEVKKGNEIFICWGFRHLFASYDYLLDATLSGRLQDRYKSKQMQKYLGKIHILDGKEFCHQVFTDVAQLPCVEVDEEVEKINKIKIGSPGNALGDIDVLAILPALRKILAIECKNLEVARNPIEMSRELESLFIGNEHVPSTVVKHQRRVEWLKINLELVLQSYGIFDNRDWTIEPILVVSNEMITPYFHKSPIPVYSYVRFLAECLPKYAN